MLPLFRSEKSTKKGRKTSNTCLNSQIWSRFMITCCWSLCWNRVVVVLVKLGHFVMICVVCCWIRVCLCFYGLFGDCWNFGNYTWMFMTFMWCSSFFVIFLCLIRKEKREKNFGCLWKDYCVGTKGVSQNLLLSFDDNKVLKLSIGYAKHLFKCTGS